MTPPASGGLTPDGLTPDGLTPAAEIFYCPYCGDEDLRDDEAGWRCRTCLRSFAVQLAAVGRPNRAPRDRDAEGRARNARPRDRLGRPLERGQVGVEPWPEGARLSASEALATAQGLLDRGWPFQAHEVLEGAWKSAPEPERALWQGLAQLAVGLTHAARGNAPGAQALLARGGEAVGRYAARAPHGIDAEGLAGWARAARRIVESGGSGPIDLTPPRLRRPARGQPG